MEDILTSVKKAIGFDENYRVFDPDLVMFINSTFATLHQLGVGPKEPFCIDVDSQSCWHEFINDDLRLNSVKSYVFIKAKMIFDPPQSSFLLDSLKTQADELEWRLMVAAETIEPEETGSEG